MLFREEIAVKKAGELLHLSECQIYRLKDRVRKMGAEDLIHGNRGRPSNRRMPETEGQQIINLFHQYYSDFRAIMLQKNLMRFMVSKKTPRPLDR
jgi:hypothetical protein